MQSALTERPRRRQAASTRGDARGAWYPPWYWPAFAAPAALWQAAFLVAALFMIVAVAFGTLDIFRNPVPVVQPWYWNAGQLGTVGREIVVPGGIYQPVYVRTFVYVAVAASIALVVGYA